MNHVNDGHGDVDPSQVSHGEAQESKQYKDVTAAKAITLIHVQNVQSLCLNKKDRFFLFYL